MSLAIQCKRLRQIREELNETQSSFAKKMGIGNTTTEYERGRTKLGGELVLRLLSDYNINPLWLYGESEQKYLNPNDKNVHPSVITVDNAGYQNILMVNEKAAAGYAGNLNNDEFHEQLPAFSFPIPEYRNATFRCFQVEGYSMSPTILPGEWIITKAIDQITEIKNNNIYVIVDHEGIRIKQVWNEPEMQYLVLKSINKDYKLESVKYGEIVELWEFHSKISKELIMDSAQSKLDLIYNDMQVLKAKIIGDGIA